MMWFLKKASGFCVHCLFHAADTALVKPSTLHVVKTSIFPQLTPLFFSLSYLSDASFILDYSLNSAL
jgi:hypothetical protein